MTGDIPTKLVKAPNLPARCSWKTLRPPEPQGPPRFIDRCNKKYGYIPDDAAAPTWDSLRLVQEAIQSCGKITGNIEKDRKCVRNDLANIKEFGGITGKMTFTEEDDPIKCAVIVKISDKGEFEFYQSVCP